MSGSIPVALLGALLLAALYLMSEATHNSTLFGELYSLLLVINVLALVLLLALIGKNLYQLVRQYRRGAPGARLTARLVVMFTLLSVAPVSVVYYFALDFLHRGIDSWFDVRVEQALDDALVLSRTSLDMRMRELLRQTRRMAGGLVHVPEGMAAITLNDLRAASSATELALFTAGGHIIAASSAESMSIVPARPDESTLLQVRQGHDYVGLDPVGQGSLHVRAVVTIPTDSPVGEPHVLQALYPVTARMNALAGSVQDAFAQYTELAYLRQPLKYSFTLTLSLILLLSLLGAVWAAFYSARRLVSPVTDLAEGTRAVAAGDYTKRLPLPGNDELGFLVRSFNEMTRRLAVTRHEAAHIQQQAEHQRAYLEAVLAHLSSGVLTFDMDHRLITHNAAAAQILGTGLDRLTGSTPADLRQAAPHTHHFVHVISTHLEAATEDWGEEVILFGRGGRQVLMCRGTTLPSVGAMQAGHVIVFDDVTALIQAQRDAAWSEVARRLAHEIKNPLTPIQLSAERLRHKYLSKMPPRDAEVLDRATHTIIQQVEALKKLVGAFSHYARVPNIQLEPVDLNRVISEVLDLYRDAGTGAKLLVHFDPQTPRIEADVGRLRQVVHNLLKNALEATAGAEQARITVSTRCMEEAACRFVEMRVRDTGPGIPEEMLGHLFEPYVTSKPKGTGLGLAIVKKIVEEHGGMVWAENNGERGASIVIRLPVLRTGRERHRPHGAGRPGAENGHGDNNHAAA